MSNTFLQAEKTRLLDRIAEIRASGPIAEAYYFLSPNTVTSETGVTYEYVRLMTQRRSTDKQKIKSLGRAGSEQHRYWQRAIARREAILELEQQLKLLTDLIDRQEAHRELTEQTIEEPQ